MKNLLLLVFVTSTTSLLAQSSSPTSKLRFKTSLTDIGRGNPSFYLDHRLGAHARLQYGAGLTMDDIYALNQWNGNQYIKRDKPADTRGSFALGFNFYPITTHPNWYFGVEGKMRRYYSADKDFFFETNGQWTGSKRIERDAKVKIGYNFESLKGFLLDIGIGCVYIHSKDYWRVYHHYTQSSPSYFTSGSPIVNKIIPCIDVQIGFGNKRY